MVRAPCCEKMGLKKGPWTTEEDQILISYIQKYGHGNWRALPKQAGLLRCGKSCRLRWINYLRPDIKRGNFSREEEEIIIELHEMLGNRWSAIAARLPGRTDNEIKNVWHTHLKKRLKQNQGTTVSKCNSTVRRQSEPINSNIPTTGSESSGYAPMSPQPSSSDLSSVTTRETNNINIKDDHMDSSETFHQIDESFWSDAPSIENSSIPSKFPAISDELLLQFPFTSLGFGPNIDDGMEFWFNIFIGAGGHQNYQNSKDYN